MSESPRPRGTVGVVGVWPPQLHTGRAFAHVPGASGSGIPHRSDGRPPHTPRGARATDPHGRPGTTPPVPGRPRTFFLLLGLCAALFTLITWQVAAGGPLRRADERLGRAASGHPARPVTEFLADLGGMQVAVPVLLLAVGYAAWHGYRSGAPRWWLPPLGAALALAAVPLLIVPLKKTFDRPGPPHALGQGYYPSGHTATALVAYGAAALLLLPLLDRAGRRTLIALCVVVNLGVGGGLVLRGYHWPLDVLGSWSLCGILLLALAPLTARAAPAARTVAGAEAAGRGGAGRQC